MNDQVTAELPDQEFKLVFFKFLGPDNAGYVTLVFDRIGKNREQEIAKVRAERDMEGFKEISELTEEEKNSYHGADRNSHLV